MRGVAYADSLGMIGTMQTDETAKSRIQYEFAKCMYAIKFLPLSLSLLSLSISHMCDVFVCTCATDATMSVLCATPICDKIWFQCSSYEFCLGKLTIGINHATSRQNTMMQSHGTTAKCCYCCCSSIGAHESLIEIWEWSTLPSIRWL